MLKVQSKKSYLQISMQKTSRMSFSSTDEEEMEERRKQTEM